MESLKYESASVRVSDTHKGKKRREPVWVGRYRLAGKDSAKVLGKAWAKRSKAPDGYLTKSSAEAELLAFLESEGARLTASGGATFGAVTDAYLALLDARIAADDFRTSIKRSYKNIVEHDLRPTWGARPIGTITRDEVERYRAGLVSRGFKANTLNQYRAVLRGIFSVAVKDFAPAVSPADGFGWTRSRRTTSGKIRFYRPEEVLKLVASASEPQDAATYLTAAFTGLRQGELLALRWRSIDPTDSLIHIEQGYSEEGGEQLPKSYKVRSVPMMPQVATVLAHLRQREHFTGDDDLVFVNAVGEWVDRSALYCRYKRAQKDAKLPEITFHELRHSFGTMAVREFPITDVQVWFGHAEITTTREYIHYAPQPEAAAKLGALVGEPAGEPPGLAEVIQLPVAA